MLLLHAVHYLLQFYCDRLKDRAVVLGAVVSGIHVLVGVQMDLAVYAPHGAVIGHRAKYSRR